MRFGTQGKHSTLYVGQYLILRRISKVAYELEFPNKLTSVHPLFHVLILKKCVGNLTTIVPLECLGFKENLSYEDVPVDILECQVKKFRNKEKCSINVLWWNQLGGGATLVAEGDMISHYPHLFISNPSIS